VDEAVRRDEAIAYVAQHGALVRLTRMQRTDGALASTHEDAVEGTLASLRALMLATLPVRGT
jgi:hypothetical protein